MKLIEFDQHGMLVALSAEFCRMVSGGETVIAVNPNCIGNADCYLGVNGRCGDNRNYYLTANYDCMSNRDGYVGANGVCGPEVNTLVSVNGSCVYSGTPFGANVICG